MKTFPAGCVKSVLLVFLLFVVPGHIWSMNLPLSKELTVKLSALSSQGQLQEVASVIAKTDALGKIAFSFPTVPSSTVTPFLHLQIVDGSDILRQAIVPAPLPGGTVDAGISETTDLQARTILKAATISGNLSPLHLLVAQALLRTPAISSANAESAGAAIVAGAEAIAQVLASDSLTEKQLSTFMSALSRALTDAAALYRASVDDAVASDQNVEASRRGDAFAVLLQGVVTAGREAGINLETISTAFAAAGGAAETALEATPAIDPFTRAEIRLSYITGILNFSNYRVLSDLKTSLAHVGISLPRFEMIYGVFDLVLNTTITRQKGGEGELLTASYQNDIQAFRLLEFNSLVRQDVLMMKMGLESFTANNSSPEYGDLMLEITGRMAGMGGVMSGMTPELLLEILGRPTSPPPLFKAQQAALAAASVPTLNPYELAAWSYIYREPGFRYTPIPGLADQLVTLTTLPLVPAFDRLAEPYRSLALLMYDLAVVGSLRWQDQLAADDYSTAHPLDPPGWYPLTTVHQILENDRQRMALVRQHITGVSLDARNALMYLISSRMTEF